MKLVDLHDLSHAPDIATALGNVIVAWARAETALVQAFSAVSGAPLNMASDGYYRIPTFESRVKVIRAMIREWEPESLDKQRIDKAIEKLASLAAARNGWVHGIWVREEPSGKTVILNGRALPGGTLPIKAADILNHLEAVKARTVALEALLPPLPSLDG